MKQIIMSLEEYENEKKELYEKGRIDGANSSASSICNTLAGMVKNKGVDLRLQTNLEPETREDFMTVFNFIVKQFESESEKVRRLESPDPNLKPLEIAQTFIEAQKERINVNYTEKEIVVMSKALIQTVEALKFIAMINPNKIPNEGNIVLDNSLNNYIKAVKTLKALGITLSVVEETNNERKR